MEISHVVWLSSLSFPKSSCHYSSMASNDDNDLSLRPRLCKQAKTRSPSLSSSCHSSVLSMAEQCPVTKTKLYHFAHRWTMDNFAKLSHYNISPSVNFSPPENDQIIFQLKMFPCSEDNGYFVSVLCTLEACPKSALNVSMKLSVLDDNNQKRNAKEIEMQLIPNENQLILDKFISSELLFDLTNGLLPDNKFTIYCEINYDDDIKDLDLISNLSQLEKHCQVGIQTELYELLECGKLADVILFVGDKEFPAHKAILGARSPVFSTIFKLDQDRVEDNQREEIIDVEVDVFEELLRYIYTGKVKLLNRFADKLYIAAAKYGLDSLKQICEDSLCSNICFDSFSSLLELAFNSDAKKLKIKIVDYIKNYSYLLSGCNKLQVFLEDKQDLLYQVFCDLLKSTHNSAASFESQIETSAQVVTSALEESSWSQTKSKVIKFSHKWIISDFTTHCLFDPDGHNYIESNIFCASNDEKLKFKLKLYPKGLNESTKDHLSLLLCVIDYDNFSPMVEFKASILDCGGDKCNSEAVRKFVFMKGITIGWYKYIFRDILLEQANELLPKDELSIYCEIEIMKDPVTSNGQISVEDNSHVRLALDLGNSFDTGELSDVTIVVGPKELRAHKVILGARSPVFAAMFDNEMKESKENRVEIDDFQVEVFEELLRFIYTGKVNNIDKFASELLEAADKYQIDSLKYACELFLSSNLTSDSIVNLLLLSDMHNAFHLKSKIIEYILNGQSTFDLLEENDSLKDMFQERPKLFYEVFCCALKNIQSL